MRVKPLRLAQLLAASELVSALLLPGAYLFPFRYGFRADNWYDPVLLLGMAGALLVVAVPAAALVGLLRTRLSAFWGLYVSPVLSLLFGVGSVPLVSQVVPAGDARFLLLIVMNAMAIGFAIWLRRQISLQTNNAVSENRHAMTIPESPLGGDR